jgi:plastocyanin
VIRRAVLAGVVVALAAAAPASAQAPVYQALDDLSGGKPRWEPDSNVTVEVKVGDTVTWRYDGTILAHNVKSTSPNWNVDTKSSTTDASPDTYTFTAEGLYTFICKFHGTTMAGQVKVGNPPPPPPPPLSEQHWVNDLQPPSRFEVGDQTRPRLSRVRAAAVRDGARVRFRLSERARVRVRFKLAGVTVKTVRRTFRAGPRRLTVRDPRMHGRYRIDVLARDLAGNRSRVAVERVTLR